MNLIEFLKARLDEDEAAANRAIALDWRVDPDDRHHVRVVPAQDAQGPGAVIAYVVGGEAPHIARHHPARVLREVEAKRRIIAEHAATLTIGFDDGSTESRTWCSRCGEKACPTLRLLAEVHADHPNYDETWRPRT